MKKLFFGVVASIRPTSLAELKNLLATIRKYAITSIEIRLDGLPDNELESALRVLPAIMRSTGKPFILTLRSKEQGGEKVISPSDQFDFWCSLAGQLDFLISEINSRVFVDWGLDLLKYCMENRKQWFPWSKVGASLHDFEGTSLDLVNMRWKLALTPAMAFLKVVPTATSETDVLRVKALFLDGFLDGNSRPLIAFPMGALGEQGRRDCLGWGSIATYGYLPGCPKTAPGQLSVDELLKDPSVRRVLQAHS